MNDISHLDAAEIEKGKIMALIAYASIFVGFPAFLLPMLQKDNAYALQHAKWAGAHFVIYLGTFMVVFAIALVTCGFGTLLVPLIFVPWVFAGLGALNALNGRTDTPPMAEPLATMLFSGVTMAPPNADQRR